MAERLDEMIARGATIDWFRIQEYVSELEYQSSMQLAQGRISVHMLTEREISKLENLMQEHGVL